MGISKVELIGKNNYTAYKTYVSDHPSIYKINNEHKQMIKKSGKQMSRNTGNKQRQLH